MSRQIVIVIEEKPGTAADTYCTIQAKNWMVLPQTQAEAGPTIGKAAQVLTAMGMSPAQAVNFLKDAVEKAQAHAAGARLGNNIVPFAPPPADPSQN